MGVASAENKQFQNSRVLRKEYNKKKAQSDRSNVSVQGNVTA